MKATFRVTRDWKISENTLVPFEVVKAEWKRQVGNKTVDGDLILEVNELNEEEIEVIIEVLSSKTKKMLGGEKIPASFIFR